MKPIKMTVWFAAPVFCLGGMLLAARTASAQQPPTTPPVPIQQPKPGHITGKVFAGSRPDIPQDPREKVFYNELGDLDRSGWTAFQQNNYAVAEAKFRASLALCEKNPAFMHGMTDPYAYRGLALSLTRQDRKAEALATYHTLLFEGGNSFKLYGGSYDATNLLNYAILLSQTGKWQDAVNAFSMAMSRRIPSESTDPPTTFAFDPMVEEPKRLQAAAHLLIGKEILHQCDYPGALPEFAEAVRLEPNLALAHYYYAGVLGHTPGQMATATAEYEKAARLDGRNITGVRNAAEQQLHPSN